MEGNTAPRRVLDWVLGSNVPMPVKDLLIVAPEFRKQLCELITVKHVTTNPSSYVVQVNELSGCNPLVVAQEYSDQVIRNDDGLIIMHHSLPLHALKAKIPGTCHSLMGILDSGSEVVAMPKHIWEELGVPLCSDHVLWMTSTNTSVNSTIGVLENLALDFNTGEVLLQVQIMGCTNFDLLLGQPFHCLMSVTTEDSPDGTQLITLCDPNMGKQYALPTCPWFEGCPHCRDKLHCSDHQSIVKMGF